MLQGLIFLGILLIVLGPVHWYLWRRLVKDTTRPGRARRIGTVAFLTLVVSLIGAFVMPRVIGPTMAFPIALVGYVWLAVMFYLLVIFAILELPRFFLLRRRRHPMVAQALAPLQEEAPVAAAPVEEVDQSRRLLITRSMAIFAGLTASGVVGYGAKTAFGDPVLKRIQVPLAKLPRSLDGYRIAVVADVHMGPLTGIEHTRRIVRNINGMNPDLVAMVGDLVDGSAAELRLNAAPFRDMITKDGAYFVTGNHEYYAGVEDWLDEVRRVGMRPLQNERLEIRGLDIAGVNDVTGDSYPDSGGGPDYAKALGDRDLAKPVVLLAHQPVMAREAAKYKVDLQLSGHTHGGQMAPFNYLVRLQQPVVSGLGEVDGTKVYVTNGAGFWGPPVRVGAPPDITLVELKAG